ncbi:hypothetical protein [Gulosibacter sp. 401352-2018]|uniref:hypothetical protein n=1 Tax=Gulosibacter hominis TaxID=2770504 RepID=UPI00191B39FC
MRAFDLQLDVGGLDFTGLLVEYGAVANHIHAPALLATKLDEGILKLMSVNRLESGTQSNMQLNGARFPESVEHLRSPIASRAAVR